MNKLYLDTETCGLHGVAVLIQYAVNDGPIHLWEPWSRPIGETLALIQSFLQYTVVGFNLTFDWFHLQKLYTLLRLCPHDWIPREHIDEIAALEEKAKDGPTIKPAGALDLMLFSRKGPYQSLMNRDPIRIRNVPCQVAPALCAELVKCIPIDPVFDAKAKPGPRWKIWPTRRKFFDNIVRTFLPSGALKSLAKHALKVEEPDNFGDVELPPEYRPVEFGFAPTAAAVSSAAQGWRTDIKQPKNRSGMAWPGVVDAHDHHWRTNERARRYGANDINYTRGLDEFFSFPEVNDDDSVLACMVGSLRWRGYKVDLDAIRKLRADAQAIVDASPVDVQLPREVRAYLLAVMTEEEKLVSRLEESTSKEVLEEMAKVTDPLWRPIETPEPCGLCDMGFQPVCGGGQRMCDRCGCTGTLVGRHPASVRAEELLKVKRAVKEVELYDKLLLAGRLHADFVVIGAKSSRMSGSGGVNAQAIKSTENVRKAFPLAPDGYILSAGDFAAFEVTIADAIYKDPELNAELRRGRKIHALFGMIAYQKTYEEICASEGQPFDMYKRAKSGVFLDMYGGEARRLAKTLGISVDEAKRAQAEWQQRYPGIAVARERIKQQYSCMVQAERGSQIVWRQPEEAAYTLLGFPRYFKVEYEMIRAMYDMANMWATRAKDTRAQQGEQSETVVRSLIRGKQTPEGAAASAIFGAAHGMNAGIIRAAGNHEIQGTGAGITKKLQRALWDLQPAGVHDAVVMPMNVHDELLVPTLPAYVDQVASIVREVVEGFRPVVPLIGIEWYRKWTTWASKKDGTAEGKMKVSFEKAA